LHILPRARNFSEVAPDPSRALGAQRGGRRTRPKSRPSRKVFVGPKNNLARIIVSSKSSSNHRGGGAHRFRRFARVVGDRVDAHVAGPPRRDGARSPRPRGAASQWVRPACPRPRCQSPRATQGSPLTAALTHWRRRAQQPRATARARTPTYGSKDAREEWDETEELQGHVGREERPGETPVGAARTYSTLQNASASVNEWPL